MVVWLVIVAIGGALYFLPTIIAATRKTPNIAAVAVINVFLGWSFIGWIVALVLALQQNQQPVQVVHVQQHIGYPPQGYVPQQMQYPQGPSGAGSHVATTFEQSVAPAPGANIQPAHQPNDLQ